MKWVEIWGRIAPRRLVIYADFIDPFCFIGFHNARRVAEAAGIGIEWHGFELNPDTPIEGSALQTADNSDLRPGMWASVQDFAKKSGLILSEPTFVPNTRLAHLWVQTVKKTDVKNSLIERIYQAYLIDKKDIGKGEVLFAIASDLGLPQESLDRIRTQTDFTSLEKYRAEAVKYRFPGMPGFIFKGKTYFGALSERAWKNVMGERT